MNLSLQKKSAARTAAVQCLYQQAVTGEDVAPEIQVAALKETLKDNRSEQKLLVGAAIEPHYPLLLALLEGIGKRGKEVDVRLDNALSKEWKRERTSPLLIAILQCAIFELFFYKEVSAKIIIDEYTRLARSFFADKEVSFVHGALSTLVKKYE